MKHLLKYLAVPLAFVLFGAPSAPVADIIMPSVGEAVGETAINCGPLPEDECRRDTDSDGTPDHMDVCPRDPNNNCPAAFVECGMDHYYGDFWERYFVYLYPWRYFYNMRTPWGRPGPGGGCY